MKYTVNLNDLRRMRQQKDAGRDVGQVSASLHIQPSVVSAWFEKLDAEKAKAAKPAEPIPAAAGPVTRKGKRHGEPGRDL